MRLNLSDHDQIEVKISDAVFVVNVLPTREIQRISEKHTKWKRGREVTDHKGFSADFWDATIASWKNLYDENGNEIPCDRANKLAVINKYPNIGSKIADEIEEYRESVLHETEFVAEKNS